MNIHTTEKKINRRSILAAIPAIAATATAAHALDKEEGPAHDGTKIPDCWRSLVADLQYYSTPHTGAADRYTVVRKADLDALYVASGLALKGGAI